MSPEEAASPTWFSRVRRVLEHVSEREGVAFGEPLFDERDRFKIGKSQKLDGLQKLRRHHQGLALPHNKLRDQRHVYVQPSTACHETDKRGRPIIGPFLA